MLHIQRSIVTTCHMLLLSGFVAHGEVLSIQHYVIMLVSDLWQVVGFLRVLRFPPPIKLTARGFKVFYNRRYFLNFSRYLKN